jgi:hypothetical protein
LIASLTELLNRRGRRARVGVERAKPFPRGGLRVERSRPFVELLRQIAQLLWDIRIEKTGEGKTDLPRRVAGGARSAVEDRLCVFGQFPPIIFERFRSLLNDS